MINFPSRILRNLLEPTGVTMLLTLKRRRDCSRVIPRSPFTWVVLCAAHEFGIEQVFRLLRHLIPNESRCLGQIVTFKEISLSSKMPIIDNNERNRPIREICCRLHLWLVFNFTCPGQQKSCLRIQRRFWNTACFEMALYILSAVNNSYYLIGSRTFWACTAISPNILWISTGRHGAHTT